MRMRTSRAARWHDQRGAALVEFSLVIVLFLVLLYGLVAFGLMLALKQSVTNSANEGARAAIGGDLAASYASAEDGLTWLGTKCCQSTTGAYTGEVSGAPLDIKPTEGFCAGTSGPRCVTVDITYDYAGTPLLPPLPGLGVVFPNTIASTGVIQLP